MMAIPLRCECGQVRGEVDASRSYVRVTCHCRDCQAYARVLGKAGLMDANGGTDIVPMAPAGILILEGMARVACMSLGPKGLLRWYSACCRTPLANTARAASLPYVGVPVACMAVSEADLAAAFGPRNAMMIFPGSALHPVAPTRWRLMLGSMRIGWGLLREKMGGRDGRDSPLFDAVGQPVRTPLVLGLAEREAYSRPP